MSSVVYLFSVEHLPVSSSRLFCFLLKLLYELSKFLFSSVTVEEEVLCYYISIHLLVIKEVFSLVMP